MDTPSERFLRLISALMGEVESGVKHLPVEDEEHTPEDWGLDTDDEAEARTDYADPMN